MGASLDSAREEDTKESSKSEIKTLEGAVMDNFQWRVVKIAVLKTILPMLLDNHKASASPPPRTVLATNFAFSEEKATLHSFCGSLLFFSRLFVRIVI